MPKESLSNRSCRQVVHVSFGGATLNNTLTVSGTTGVTGNASITGNTSITGGLSITKNGAELKEVRQKV